MSVQAVTRIEKEKILLLLGDCAVTILPQFGGKVASILVRGHELLQTPLSPYAPRTRTMSFNEGDASGWDECLPSVSDCTVQTPSGSASVPDHGDLWRVEWQLLSSANGSVTLSAEGFSLPLKLVRAITLTQTEKGYRLHADYQVTNTSTTPTPWAWSAHPGYAAEEGDKLSLPASIQELRIEWTRNNRLDKSTGKAAWPIAKLTAGGKTDLSISAEAHSGVGDKLFAGPLVPADNWVALERPKAGVRLLRLCRYPLSRPLDLPGWLSGRWRPSAALRCHGTHHRARRFARHHRPLVAHPGRRRVLLLAHDPRSRTALTSAQLSAVSRHPSES
jgi:hypothetical protein